MDDILNVNAINSLCLESAFALKETWSQSLTKVLLANFVDYLYLH